MTQLWGRERERESIFVKVGEWQMVDSLLTHLTALSAGGHADADPLSFAENADKNPFNSLATPLPLCHGPWGWLLKSNEAILLCNTSGGVTGGQSGVYEAIRLTVKLLSFRFRKEDIYRA